MLALDAYYEGEQRLKLLGLAVPDDLVEFMVIVGWPGTFVKAINNRRVVEGFRLPGQSKADRDLWEIWQANDLDSESKMARTDSLVFGRAYYCVGSPDESGDAPLVTVESPLEMTHEWSNRKRMVTAAARFYTDDSTGRTEQCATLYQPDSTIWLVKNGRGWEEIDRDDHMFGECLVEPLVNEPRTHNRYGSSKMLPVLTKTDAAARALTNAQLATEILAAPQRYGSGMKKSDFQDPETGEQLTAWETYLGAVWSTENENAKFGQFTAADLANFAKIVSHYAQLCSGDTGLPMRYFGQLSDNPPSADGIRADEGRLVQECEDANTVEAGALERVMRKARRIQTGADIADGFMMETIHRNPATPTLAQTADAAVKSHAEGLISRRQALRDMRYTETQISTIEAELAEEQASGLVSQLLKPLADSGAPVGA